MTPKAFLKLLPWALVFVLVFYLWLTRLGDFYKPAQEQASTHIVVKQVETLGSLELVKYHMQQIIEFKRESEKYLDLGFFKIQAGGDSKAALIAQGEASACIDLTKLQDQDIQFENDTLYLTLPYPELCHYQVNLDKSKIYDLQKGAGVSQEDFQGFLDSLYSKAERQMKQGALQSGILQEAENMGYKLIPGMVENLLHKPTVVYFKKSDTLKLSPAL